MVQSFAHSPVLLNSRLKQTCSCTCLAGHRSDPLAPAQPLELQWVLIREYYSSSEHHPVYWLSWKYLTKQNCNTVGYSGVTSVFFLLCLILEMIYIPAGCQLSSYMLRLTVEEAHCYLKSPVLWDSLRPHGL